MSSTPFIASESERYPVSAAASAKVDGLLIFGTLKAVQGERLQVELGADLEVGAALELRIELTPAPGTALLTGVVTRALLVAPGETQRYLIRVTDVAVGDQERCADFLTAVRNGGGTLSTFSGVSDVRDGGRAGMKGALRTAVLGSTLPGRAASEGVTVLE